ncbi:MAG: hypothetical protein IKI67_03955 [Bacteroidales bacterium]|nr:hypothetical protein [Bacteroidales bacterium]
MRVLKAVIENCEHNLSAYIEGVDGIAATGANINELKQNLTTALEEFVYACKELGCELPKELEGDYYLNFVRAEAYTSC